MKPPSAPDVLNRRLIFVNGKGGVGKTVVSRAVARALAARGQRTLWACFADPMRGPGEVRRISAHLSELNCEPGAAFAEYVERKIKLPALAKIFLHNQLITYLAQAAPGLRELVLLGKVWAERENFDHVVVDMPSTGYGLTLFQSTKNFSHLFSGGPLHTDAEAMLRTFNDPKDSGQIIVALPEEMPLQEGLEMKRFLEEMFPANPPAFLVNRTFPKTQSKVSVSADPGAWPSPLASSAADYCAKRQLLEAFNLKSWEGLPYSTLNYLPPDQDIAVALSAQVTQLLQRDVA